jgi:hypothetical protein
MWSIEIICVDPIEPIQFSNLLFAVEAESKFASHPITVNFSLILMS